ncbi:hypothetical protein [Polyangium mundeleinium]|uniref:PEGA domain-containing protein n=1 Tax=Polyangium mundeleinium TaxID=2995306 RepID=A0ABT5F092_9BACT|nr:hypothetical protein [Polyangium mundeleinium]MDC0747512.1 hypothetical protein [Polyangium mundeleinium]
MVRSGIVIAAILTLGAPALAEEAPRPVVDDAVQAARFAALVAKADRERAAGRLPEAAMAYAEAFKIKEEPIVGGRLGALLVELRNPIQAADLLLDAIERGQDVSSDERHAWLSAYDVARSQVCRVEVTVSEPHSRVTLDGLPKNREGHTGFILFVPPGEHELRATLKGFEDAVIDFKAIKGGTLRYTLALRALPSFAPIDPPERLLRRRQLDPATNVEEPPDDELPKRDPIRGGVTDEKKSGIGGTISAGPVMVFGVATWAPAVGAVLGGSLRPNEVVSLGIEGRAAWLTSGVEGRPIDAMTAGGLVSACAHYRWFFGCVLGHVGVININGSPEGYKPLSVTAVKPGGGGRVGAKVQITRSFSIQAAADVLGLSSGIKIAVGPTIIAEQPPIMLGVQLGGGWEF